MRPIFSYNKQDCKEPKYIPKWGLANMHIFNFVYQRDGFN